MRLAELAWSVWGNREFIVLGVLRTGDRFRGIDSVLEFVTLQILVWAPLLDNIVI